VHELPRVCSSSLPSNASLSLTVDTVLFKCSTHPDMAQPRDHAFSPGPAGASGTPTSFRSTSEVRLTSSSDARRHSMSRDHVERMPRDTPALSQSLTDHREISLVLGKDPFITPVRGTRLSPTASTFTPYTEAEHDSLLPDKDASISRTLSSDLGLSRAIQVFSQQDLLLTDVERMLSVSQGWPV
jgi:hypothetical protein